MMTLPTYTPSSSPMSSSLSPLLLTPLAIHQRSAWSSGNALRNESLMKASSIIEPSSGIGRQAFHTNTIINTAATLNDAKITALVGLSSQLSCSSKRNDIEPHARDKKGHIPMLNHAAQMHRHHIHVPTNAQSILAPVWVSDSDSDDFEHNTRIPPVLTSSAIGHLEYVMIIPPIPPPILTTTPSLPVEDVDVAVTDVVRRGRSAFWSHSTNIAGSSSLSLSISILSDYGRARAALSRLITLEHRLMSLIGLFPLLSHHHPHGVNQ
jgi:hypothetical protein